MKSFLQYLYSYRKGIGAFGLFSVIFFTIFFLYGLPAEAVLYASAVCGFVGLLLFLRNYLHFQQKYRQLSLLKEEVGISLEKLPDAEHGLEALYQELLGELYRQKQQCLYENANRYQELTEYYTIWAHQIKTPIAAMDLILQREDSGFSREVRQELRRIEQYVEMVLAVLRLDSDSSDYVIREYDLDGMLRQALRKYASQFIYRKISLTYEPVGQRVVTDEKWLVFVIEQLLSNALKYTKNGSISIFLEAPKTLCIRDTGIGIAPEDLPRVFEKGYTGCNGRRDKKASGIGLYLCRRILEKLGHGISVESELGAGTVVRLDLWQKEESVFE